MAAMYVFLLRGSSPLLSLSSSASLPSFSTLPLFVSLSVPLSVRASLVHTEAGCSVVTGDTALRVQRHL